MPTRQELLESAGYPIDRLVTGGTLFDSLAVDGTTVYVSGHVPFDGDDLLYVGKVPSQVSVEDAKKAAALCTANILRAVHKELGSLERITRVVRITGFVNSDPDFTEQHIVMNGASKLVREVFGEAGRHTRSAIGMATLPRGVSVEVEAVAELKP